MIGYLKGKVILSANELMIVDVNGVGYELNVAGIDALEGQEVEIFVHTHMRENDIKLFGFTSREDLSLFKFLIGVNSVGPKSALAIIKNHGSDRIIEAILTERPEMIKTSGVGEKTSKKIVLELKSKLKDKKYTAGSISEDKVQYQEAYDALIALGYTSKEVMNVVKIIEEDSADLNTSGVVKRALAYLSK